MKHSKWSIKTLVIFLTCLMVLQLTACGFILYPERRGQTTGQIDVGVAIMDGIGLLFFIIPGVVAFAVDFTNGTIYLPSGNSSSLKVPDDQAMLAVRVPSDQMNKHGIESTVENFIGHAISLDSKDMQVYELDSVDQFWSEYARALNIPEPSRWAQK
jgi:hypothetical protein